MDRHPLSPGGNTLVFLDHYCPVNSEPIARKANINAGLRWFSGVHDLNFEKNRMIETKGFY